MSGPGEIAAVDNGDATSLLPFQGSEMDAFHGLALVVLRARRGQSGTIELRRKPPDYPSRSSTSPPANEPLDRRHRGFPKSLMDRRQSSSIATAVLQSRADGRS